MIKKKNFSQIDNKLLSSIMDKFKNCDDFLCSKITSDVTNVEIYKMYINQLVDKDLIDNGILKPLSFELDKINSSTDLLNILKQGKIYHLDIVF